MSVFQIGFLADLEIIFFISSPGPLAQSRVENEQGRASIVRDTLSYGFYGIFFWWRLIKLLDTHTYYCTVQSYYCVRVAICSGA